MQNLIVTAVFKNHSLYVVWDFQTCCFRNRHITKLWILTDTLNTHHLKLHTTFLQHIEVIFFLIINYLHSCKKFLCQDSLATVLSYFQLIQVFYGKTSFYQSQSYGLYLGMQLLLIPTVHGNQYCHTQNDSTNSHSCKWLWTIYFCTYKQ